MSQKTRTFTNFFKALESHITTLVNGVFPNGQKKELKAKFAEAWKENVEDLHQLIFQTMPVLTATSSMLDVIVLKAGKTKRPPSDKNVFAAHLANLKGKEKLESPLKKTEAQKAADKNLTKKEQNTNKGVAQKAYSAEVKRRFEAIPKKDQLMYKAIGIFTADFKTDDEKKELYGYEMDKKKVKINTLTKGWRKVKAAWDALDKDEQKSYLDRASGKVVDDKERQNINDILCDPENQEKLLKAHTTSSRDGSSGKAGKKVASDLNLTALTHFKRLMSEQRTEYPEGCGISERDWARLREAVEKQKGDNRNQQVVALWDEIKAAKSTSKFKRIKSELDKAIIDIRAAYREEHPEEADAADEKKRQKEEEREAKKAAKKKGGKTAKTSKSASKTTSRAGSKTTSPKTSKPATPAASDDEAEPEPEVEQEKEKKTSKSKSKPKPEVKVSKSKSKKAPEPEPEAEEPEVEAEPEDKEEEMPETQAFDPVSDVEEEQENQEPTPPPKKHKSKSSKSAKAEKEDKPKKSSKGKALLSSAAEDTVLEEEVEAWRDGKLQGKNR